MSRAGGGRKGGWAPCSSGSSSGGIPEPGGSLRLRKPIKQFSHCDTAAMEFVSAKDTEGALGRVS